MEFRCKELERKATGLSKITIKQGIEAKGIDEIKKFIKSQEPIMKKNYFLFRKVCSTSRIAFGSNRLKFTTASTITKKSGTSTRRRETGKTFWLTRYQT